MFQRRRGTEVSPRCWKLILLLINIYNLLPSKCSFAHVLLALAPWPFWRPDSRIPLHSVAPLPWPARARHSVPRPSALWLLLARYEDSTGRDALACAPCDF